MVVEKPAERIWVLVWMVSTGFSMPSSLNIYISLKTYEDWPNAVSDADSKHCRIHDWSHCDEQCRIHDFQGELNPKGGRQPIIWLSFTKNCMKMKKIGRRGGVCPKCCYLDPPLMSSDEVSIFPGIAGPLSLEMSRDSSPETKPKAKKKATPSGKKKHKEPTTGKDTSEPLCRVVPAEVLEKGDLLLRKCFHRRVSVQ